ncbi:MAG: hypothetical protein AAGC47_01580, partial [Bacteroidota bacterium]
YQEYECFSNCKSQIISCKEWYSDSDSSAQQLTSIETEAEYNIQGQLVSFIDSSIFKTENIETSLYQKCKLEYDSLSRLSSMNWYDLTQLPTTLIQLHEKDTLHKSIPRQRENEVIGRLNHRLEFEYNDEGLVKSIRSKVFSVIDNSLHERTKSRIEYSFEYDEEGNWIKSYFRRGEGSRFLETTREIEYR